MSSFKIRKPKVLRLIKTISSGTKVLSGTYDTLVSRVSDVFIDLWVLEAVTEQIRTFTECWDNDGPPSTTADHHCLNIGWASVLPE